MFAQHLLNFTVPTYNTPLWFFRNIQEIFNFGKFSLKSAIMAHVCFNDPEPGITECQAFYVKRVQYLEGFRSQVESELRQKYAAIASDLGPHGGSSRPSDLVAQLKQQMVCFWKNIILNRPVLS